MSKQHYIGLFVFITIVCGCINYTNTGTQQFETTASKSKEYFTDDSSGIIDIRSVSPEDNRPSKRLCSINYRSYKVLFDQQAKIPVWVKYELTAAETDGPYSRKGKNFRSDDSIKILQADNSDYRNSGWSRGHMAPAGDFKWSDEAMWDTFYFTNCCPQNEKLNNGQWKTLEEKVRTWAVRYGKVNVITGPIIGKNVYGTIGANKVVVPDAFFKAVLADTHSGLQTIAFVMYNTDTNENMHTCLSGCQPEDSQRPFPSGLSSLEAERL